MVNKKENKKINAISGRLNTSIFCFSINSKMNLPIIDIFGGGTEAIRRFFIIKYNLEDNWDLEKEIQKICLEKAGIRRKDNLTKEVEITLAKYMIEIYKEKINKTKLNEEQLKEIKSWIKDLEEIIQ